MKKVKNIYLSITIPCYNEKENLKRGVLSEVWKYLKKQDYSWEVIVSDDGSTDGSLKLVRSFARKHKGFRVLENKHKGKPWALWQGIKAVKGKYILFADMDQSTPIDQLGKLLSWLKKGHEVVIGSRGIERKNFPFFRKIGAAVFRNFRKSLLLPQINDTQCGFKLFKTKVAKEIFPKLEVLKKHGSGWTVTSYDVELLFIIDKLGIKIKEAIVDWEDRDVSLGKGKSYIARYFKESKEMFGQILKVKLNDWQGKYDE